MNDPTPIPVTFQRLGGAHVLVFSDAEATALGVADGTAYRIDVSDGLVRLVRQAEEAPASE